MPILKMVLALKQILSLYGHWMKGHGVPLKKRTALRPIWHVINEHMAFPPLCSAEAEQARNSLGACGPRSGQLVKNGFKNHGTAMTLLLWNNLKTATSHPLTLPEWVVVF